MASTGNNSSATLHLAAKSSRCQKEGGEYSALFEIARVLVRFDHVARCIVSADHSSPLAVLGDASEAVLAETNWNRYCRCG
jgi:hypothetical protein